MPKIISRQPAWLARSTPAHQLFDVKTPGQHENHPNSKRKLENPGLRLLAHRGSEVFVADGNIVRWGDLASMKDQWESELDGAQFSTGNDATLDEAHYKVLEFRYVAEPILQLVISPNNALLAVVTAHTIHICVIPDSKYLSEPDEGPIRPKVQMLGPTTHVVSASRIVRTLWHPFGVAGNCLVTITEDAAIRVWELSLQSRYSFEKPTVALDLRKLRVATSAKDDVRPRPLGISKGISYDSVGMDVASACFGGTGATEELGWSGMTLWLAMADGDVYALCPLLPKKWQAHPSVLRHLTNVVLATENEQKSATEMTCFTAQWQWLAEAESEPPIEAARRNDFEQPSWIYTQPAKEGLLPKLQGPFSIIPGNLEDELALADIHVIAPTYSAYYANDQDGNRFLDGVPVATICLLDQAAKVYICAETTVTYGQWLPEQAIAKAEEDSLGPELIVLGALTTLESTRSHPSGLARWPTITPDQHSKHDFYVTHSQGIWYVSTSAWIQSLENEMSAETDAGTEFRMAVEFEGNRLSRQKIIPLLDHDEDQPSAPLVMYDSDLGYIILTVYKSSPQAALLDFSSTTEATTHHTDVRIKRESPPPPDVDEISELPPRAAYIPSKVFKDDQNALVHRLRNTSSLSAKTSQIVLKENIRLSPAVLDFMTSDHRVLSEETHKLGLAIADLFTRCRMLQAEFSAELQRMRDVAERVNRISEDCTSEPVTSSAVHDGSDILESRLNTAKDRQTALMSRFKALRKKTSTISRPLSDREKSWVGEVNRVARDVPEAMHDNGDQSLDQDSDSDSISRTSRNTQKNHLQRYTEARELAQEVCAEVRELVDTLSTQQNGVASQSTSVSESRTNSSPSKALRVPPDIRRQKMAKLQDLLDRESALVDAVSERLERLGV